MPRLLSAAWALLAACPLGAEGFLVGIDLGSQYFKAAVVAPGRPFEVVHNQHSKRKTPTAVSFFEKVRTFGDDAVASASRSTAKTPMLFPLQLGRNLTGVAPEKIHWLPTSFYPYSLGVNESGSLRFDLGDGVSYTVEEVTAHLLSFAKGLARQVVDGTAVSETVLTVPSQATMLQRRALLTSAQIAGLPRPQLIHETAAAALQRALDLDLSGTNGISNTSTVLYYNMGARHVEACIVGYQGATHMGKSTVAMTILGCGVNRDIGGHQVDLTIAEKMLNAFKAKHPKLASIDSSLRALKKLEKEANSAKHVLSANKEAQFRVEALYEDTDFAQQMSREQMEDWCKDLFAGFKRPIEEALALANVSLADLDTVEMIGGGWRIPRIQGLLSEYLLSQRPSGAAALNLSQHVNGDEAMATGAAFYGANSSISFRTKRIFFSDTTQHGYTLVLTPLDLTQPHEDGWTRSVELFPPHALLRSKKGVKLTASFDLQVTLLEDGNPVLHWNLTGAHAAATGQFANLAAPLISLKFELDGSGVVKLATATAVFDEPQTAATAAATAAETVEPAAATPAEEANASTGEANASAEGEPSESGESPEQAEGQEASETAKDEAGADGEPEKNATQATKVKKRKVSINVKEYYEGIRPRPLLDAEKKQAMERLEAIDAADAEVRRISAAKNALESFVYDSREKLSSDEACLQVSAEEDRAKITEMLTQMEEWLYEDEAANANASLLEDKLHGLQEHVSPIMRRAWELEQRALVSDVAEKLLIWATETLTFVENNMTWVEAKDREGVVKLTETFRTWLAEVTEQQAKKALTEEPAFSVREVKAKLDKIRSEATRLTKIRKIDPMPYSSDYGRGGRGGFNDAYMRTFYERMYKNMTNNGTDMNFSEWFKNFTNFSGFNDSDYTRSFQDAADNFTAGAEEGKAEKPSGTDGAKAEEGKGEEGKGEEGDKAEL